MSRRAVAWGLSATGLVLVLLLCLAWALISTEWGTRRVWGFVAERLPEGLTVGSVAGRVRSPLVFEGIVFRGEASTVRVDRVGVEWSLRPLLRRTLPMRNLEADEVTVELHEAAAPLAGEAAPLPLPALALPVTVLVERAVVRRLSVVLPGQEGRRVELDSVGVRGFAFDDRLEVATVVGAGPDGTFSGGGWLTPRGEYPLSIEVEVEGLLPELAPVRGRFSLSGTLGRLVVGATVTEPVAAELSATVESPRSHATFEAELTVHDFDAPAVRDDWPALKAQGTLTASGSLDSIHARADARVETPQTGRVPVEGVVRHTGSTLSIERLRATIRGARMETRGSVVFGGAEPILDLMLNGAALRWPLVTPPLVRVDTAWAQVQGTASAYRVTGGGRGRQVEGPSARVWLTGNGTPDEFGVVDLHVAVLDGTIRARGSVGWVPVPRWNLTTSIEDVDPSTLLPTTTPLQGRVTLRGRTRGRVAAGGTEGSVAVEELRGTLRGEAVEGTVTAAFRLPVTARGATPASPQLFLDELELAWGSNTLSAAGTVADTLDLRLILEAPGLARVFPDAEGRVDVVAAIFGPRAAPGVEATVTGQGLSYQSQGVEEIALAVKIDSRSGGLVDVHGVATGLFLSGTVMDSLTVGASGTPEAHDITGRLSAAAGTVDVGASGGIRDASWSGFLSRSDVHAESLGAWALADSVRVTLASGRGEMETGCWRSEAATACASGSWQAEGPTSVHAVIRDLPLGRFERSLPEGWTVTGLLGVDASLRIAADRALELGAHADLGSGRISYPSSRGRRTLTYSGALVEALTDADGSRASIGMGLSNEESSTVASLTGSVELPGFTHLGQPVPTQSVQGRMEASVNDFSALEGMVPSLEDIAGALDVDITVSGTLGTPELEGEARLREGRADLPRAGLEIRDLEWTALGLGRTGVAVEGQLRSGPGTVHFSGTVPARPTLASPATLQISGERVLALDIPEASVWISPTLDVTASSERVDVTGRVDIPRARVELREVAPTGVAPSRDVVFVGDSASAVRGPDIHTNVRISLGDSVTFRGFGLSAEPQGAILADDAPGRATTATGEIILNRGRYRAYGQELTMDRGRIIYAGGPLDNPGLDIRASRQASDGVVAGLDVRGTVRYPEVTLFSEPTLTQSEVLAYIVLGRPLGTASTSEGSRVAGAAASLGIKGGNALAGRIGQRFGLDEVRIEAEGPLRGASLVAGTYLSPRLYVSYGVGLFEPINTFRMRYTLSRLWTLQAESGKATGADLMYRIQRGR